MSEERPSSKDSSKEKSEGKTEGRSPNKDITPVLRGWDYEPGTINVRKVSGIDGSPKLQMRQDLGLLQMEMTGRPNSSICRRPSSRRICTLGWPSVPTILRTLMVPGS